MYLTLYYSRHIIRTSCFQPCLLFIFLNTIRKGKASGIGGLHSVGQEAKRSEEIGGCDPPEGAGDEAERI